MAVATPAKYPIPAGPAEIELRVSNSRFIAFADYSPTVEAARALIARRRAELAGASHHVYGYVVGFGASVTAGMSDDGEPSGTAGRPVLAVVRGSKLGDLCVVVTRYFGGTLLGTGGLVKAYGDAAKAVLAELERTEKVERVAVRFEVPYNFYDPVKQIVVGHDAQIENEEFGAAVTLIAAVPVDRLTSLAATVRERTNGQVLAATPDAQ